MSGIGLGGTNNSDCTLVGAVVGATTAPGVGKVVGTSVVVKVSLLLLLVGVFVIKEVIVLVGLLLGELETRRLGVVVGCCVLGVVVEVVFVVAVRIGDNDGYSEGDRLTSWSSGPGGCTGSIVVVSLWLLLLMFDVPPLSGGC